MPEGVTIDKGRGVDIGAGAGSAAGNLALFLGAAGPGGEAEFQQIVDTWQALKTSNFDFRRLPPAQLHVVAEYFPELWEAEVPEDVKIINDSPEMREAQVRGVANLERIAEEGLPLADRLAVGEMQRTVQDVGKQNQAAIAGRLARRGQLGVGDELQIRLKGEQAQMEAARDMGTALTESILDRRLRANESLIGGAGGVRGQDVLTQGANANIVNAFNEMMARTRTEANRARAGDINLGRLYNVGTAQKVRGEMNPMLAYQALVRGQEYPNLLKEKEFGQRVTKTAGLTQGLAGLGQAKYDEQAAKAGAIRGMAEGAGGFLGGMLPF